MSINKLNPTIASVTLCADAQAAPATLAAEANVMQLDGQLNSRHVNWYSDFWEATIVLFITAIVATAAFIVAALGWNYLYFFRVIPYLKTHGFEVSGFWVGTKCDAYTNKFSELCEKNEDDVAGEAVKRRMHALRVIGGSAAVYLFLWAYLWK